MNTQHSGGMPKGRRKRGNLGGHSRTKLEIGLHKDEHAQIKEAAAFRHITMSQLCADAGVEAARKILTEKYARRG